MPGPAQVTITAWAALQERRPGVVLYPAEQLRQANLRAERLLAEHLPAVRVPCSS